MKRWLAVSAFSALVALSTLAGVYAQGVSQPFTYQGYLRQGGAPLNNPSQSMQFRIYDALTGGTLLWNSGALTVNVSNGLFTVQLNPPVSVWTGADRFLEIQVGATTLSPRVRLGATPYANTATLLNIFQSGTNNPDRMVISIRPNSDRGLMYRDSDKSFHFVGFGGTVLSVNVGDTLGGGIRIPWNAAAGRVLTSDAAGNASWQALPAGATAWEYNVDGDHIYYAYTGGVGIGISSPASKLHVRYASGRAGIASTGPSGDTWLPFGDGNAYISASNIIFRNSANVERVRITSAGDVGIGTATPAAKLHVNGTARVNVLEITGADLAEKFPTTETLEPGTVVEIDPDNPGQLRKARGAYNTDHRAIVR